MSGFASHGRGVLRRSVSTPVGLHPVLVNEVKQRVDQCDPARTILGSRGFREGLLQQPQGQTRAVSPRAVAVPNADEIFADLRSLEGAINEMEATHVSAQRLCSTFCSSTTEVIKETNVPQGTAHQSLQTDPTRMSTSQASFSSIPSCVTNRSPLPDGPVYTAFQKELNAIRGESVDDKQSNDVSPRANSSLYNPSAPAGQQMLQSQLDEARASNRMFQRALAAVQKRLKAVEKERDQIKAERDHFKSVLTAAQRATYDTISENQWSLDSIDYFKKVLDWDQIDWQSAVQRNIHTALKRNQLALR